MSTMLLVDGARRPHQQVPLGRAPITDPIHNLSFIEMASNSHPRALNLSVALPQRQLFAINPSPNAEGNTPSLGSFQEQAVCDCPAMAFWMATRSPLVHFCPQSLRTLCRCVWGGKEVLEGMEHPVVLWLWQVNEWL